MKKYLCYLLVYGLINLTVIAGINSIFIPDANAGGSGQSQTGTGDNHRLTDALLPAIGLAVLVTVFTVTQRNYKDFASDYYSGYADRISGENRFKVGVSIIDASQFTNQHHSYRPSDHNNFEDQLGAPAAMLSMRW